MSWRSKLASRNTFGNQLLGLSVIFAVALVAACADDSSQSDGGGGVPDARLELCDDGVDNDKDGKADCADPDCAYAPQCSDGAVPPDLGRRDKGTPTPDTTKDQGRPDDKGTPLHDTTIDKGTPTPDTTVDTGASDTTVDSGVSDTTVDTGASDTTVDGGTADQGAG